MYSPTDLHGYVLFKQKYAIFDGYKNIKKIKECIGGYAELLFIIRVLVYDTITHASMDLVSSPIPLWPLCCLLPPILFFNDFGYRHLR